MAKYSMKKGGKEVGPASVYAEPHTMTGKKIKSVVVGEESAKETMRKANVSVANTRSQDYPPTKTTGIKMRGTGAAPKGLMSRGPMA